jgi:hypothetical protein
VVLITGALPSAIPQAEIERFRAEIRDIEMLVALYARYADEQDANPRDGDRMEVKSEEQTSPDREDTPDRKDVSGNGMVTQEQFENDVRRVLIDSGRPMKRGQLINGLHSRGLRVGGSNEAKNFGTKIWKARDRFINIASEGYWPKDIPCSAVQYDPSQPLADTPLPLRVSGNQD